MFQETHRWLASVALGKVHFVAALLLFLFISASLKLLLISPNTLHHALPVRDCSSDRAKQKPTPFWQEAEKHMNYSYRATAAVHILRRHHVLPSKGAVVDMGSGFQQLRRQLPSSALYIPVDVENRVPGSDTIICNLNELEFPFLDTVPVAAFVFLGSFEYIADKLTVLRLCRRKKAHIVMEYHFVGSGDHRKEYNWVAPLTAHAIRDVSHIVGYSATFYFTQDKEEHDLDQVQKNRKSYILFTPV